MTFCIANVMRCGVSNMITLQQACSKGVSCKEAGTDFYKYFCPEVLRRLHGTVGSGTQP